MSLAADARAPLLCKANLNSANFGGIERVHAAGRRVSSHITPLTEARKKPSDAQLTSLWRQYQPTGKTPRAGNPQCGSGSPRLTITPAIMAKRSRFLRGRKEHSGSRSCWGGTHGVTRYEQRLVNRHSANYLTSLVKLERQRIMIGLLNSKPIAERANAQKTPQPMDPYTGQAAKASNIKNFRQLGRGNAPMAAESA